MKKVLIVDDSALMRRVLSDIINDDEQLIVEKTANNGLEALNVLQGGCRPDILLVDINMPKMDGVQLLKELNKYRIQIPVLIVSSIASQSADETIEALALGAFDFVKKPNGSIGGGYQEFRKKVLLRTYMFRAPHHTTTAAALTGGGRIPMPGEITLASKGILFLDELPEFSRSALEVLRQPLEEQKVTIARVGSSYEYPSDCSFVAAMNPCRCGYYPNRDKCRCTTADIKRYLAKISEPLLDRMDLCVETGLPEFSLYEKKGETSKQIRERVERTHRIQKKRYRKENFSYNSELTPQAMKKYCVMGTAEKELLEFLFHEEQMSARRLCRIVRVSRTIADLEKSDTILESHITEAVRFRSVDRKYWGVETI